ncbi:MAG TPA: GTPase ObgE [Anaerolineales bacterium]|nr:GTPase ObgE [Anaerolineales bacterium]
MYFDEAIITVRSGNGGSGAIHFRREKFVTHGGPDGGDGGRGGDVILEVIPTLNTLLSFKHKTEFNAENGRDGQGRKMFGKSAAPLPILLPPGTVVRDADTGELLGDLTEPGQRLVAAKGGRGGRGNAKFASSRNQAPQVAEKGEPGAERRLKLELKLIADVGIVGVPNAGKSTLLASVTAARPKIALYPFTTLQPNLGVAELDDHQTLILADIPGLIEGAHLGTGLGFDFLRHIQRTRVLIHLLDGAGADPLADFSQINAELALFDESLTRKPQIVALNKMDLPDAQAKWPAVQAELERRGYEAMAISAVAQTGVRDLLYRAAQRLAEAPPPSTAEGMPVYHGPKDEADFAVTREPDGAFRVRGARIERAAKMTYWEYDEAVQRFQQILEVLGIRQALADAGIKEGDTVYIGEYELEWSD